MEGLAPLRRGSVRTLQVNVTRRCNLACHHCHVESGPKRTEALSAAGADRVLEVLALNPQVEVLDLTGGAPELSEHFRPLVRGARELGRAILIFPEGHRSRDGEIGHFTGAGTMAALEERRMPVYLVINDGLWKARRLVDFVFRIHRLRGKLRVVGPITPPERDDEIEAFVHSLRDRLVDELARMREARP